MIRMITLFVALIVSSSLCISMWWISTAHSTYGAQRQTMSVLSSKQRRKQPVIQSKQARLGSLRENTESLLDDDDYDGEEEQSVDNEEPDRNAAYRDPHDVADLISSEPGQENRENTERIETTHKEETSLSDENVPKNVSLGIYRSKEEMDGRSKRFPRVDERVRLYMTNWYHHSCQRDNSDASVHYNFTPNPNNKSLSADLLLVREMRTEKEKIRGLLRMFSVNATTEFDMLHYVESHNDAFQNQCKNEYCQDMIRYLLPAVKRNLIRSPILYQFSDVEKSRGFCVTKKRMAAYPSIPVFKKFRNSLTKAERLRVLEGNCAPTPRPIPKTIVEEMRTGKVNANAQPIVFKFKTRRHFGLAASVPAHDIPWDQKKNQAIFRGQFTGHYTPGINTTMIKNGPVREQCRLLHRCKLVYDSGRNENSLVDAKLALPVLEIRKEFPKIIDGIPLYGERMTVPDMLAYKAIIMLEGNDVSSGLKWALYSKSVVLAQTPTKTSWAMEELLEPWVHFIPLREDLSDVEEKMQWVLDNDAEAQKIARNGQLWISDLVFHPDAERDDERIADDIVRRYNAHFVRNLTMVAEPGFDLLDS